MDTDRRAELTRTVGWVGIPWAAHQTEALARYAMWLGTEGIAIGGIGPAERPRIWKRHILDSLVLGRGCLGASTVLDIGSGVGLPGIPLAIAFPDTRFTLVERSGRRTDALHRAAAIVGCPVEVVHDDVARVRRVVDRVVARASLTPQEAVNVAVPLLDASGEVWVALGRNPSDDRVNAWATISAPEGWEATLVVVPPEILDSSVWMLRIARP